VLEIITFKSQFEKKAREEELEEQHRAQWAQAKSKVRDGPEPNSSGTSESSR
jgi:hypothetical protein